MNKEEIKEILDKLKLLCYDDYCLEFLVDYIERKEEKILLDYITNLQQDLDKANNIIEKDRQFYKCRMDELVNLKQENKQLKEILNEIKNIDIFKEFTFPLMKRWEEQQVLSSIDYQFKNTFIRKINELESSDNNE